MTNFEYVRGQGFVLRVAPGATKPQKFFFGRIHAAKRARVTLRHFTRVAGLAHVTPIHFEGSHESASFYTQSDIAAVIEYRRTHPSGVRATASRRQQAIPPDLLADSSHL